MIPHSLGRIAYEAYRKSVDGRTWGGYEMTDWERLDDARRDAWEDAADAIADEFAPRPR